MGDVPDATWVSASRTRNHIIGDPLLDYLSAHGAAAGFLRDDELPGHDPRTDFTAFVMEQGRAFEAALLALIATRWPIVQIGDGPRDARDPAKVAATVAAMRDGAPFIAQAVLHDPELRTFGLADLLVRSDVLAGLFPDDLGAEDAAVGAPAIGAAGHHYRAVDIKFTTLDLLVDGAVGGDARQLAYAAQVYIYTRALGHAQGYLPPAGYLWGRDHILGGRRGGGSLARLGRVDLDREIPARETDLAGLVTAALAWRRRLAAEGATWSVLPTPSVPELYPHARNREDAPWHAAKRRIARELGELTLLPGMNPERRAAAHARGILRWDDPRVSASELGLRAGTKTAVRLDAVLAANRSATPVLLPARIERADPAWRTAPAVEVFVDFETTSNLDDDFSRLPAIGGVGRIAQIGCGDRADGPWRFRQWTADSLDDAGERAVIEGFLAHLGALCDAAGVSIADARIIHWSAAEPAHLDTAYAAARTRHAGNDWPEQLGWYDLLENVARAEPISVTGAFDFGLKSITRAMQAAGMIDTAWEDGVGDGLGAMIATFVAERERRRDGGRLSEHPLMRAVAAYNEVDCRAMADVLDVLRATR